MTIVAHPLDAVAALGAAALFGGMLLFATVVTPTVFRSLTGTPVQAFLRSVFPLYYLYVIVTSLAGGLATISSNPRLGSALLAIAAAAVVLRQVVMPRVNAARDAELAGDTQAKSRFQMLHRFSVAVNLTQLLLAGVVVVRLLP